MLYIVLLYILYNIVVSSSNHLFFIVIILQRNEFPLPFRRFALMGKEATSTRHFYLGHLNIYVVQDTRVSSLLCMDVYKMPHEICFYYISLAI